MTRIYHTASRVVIYLGEKGDDINSYTVLDWLQKLHAPYDPVHRGHRLDPPGRPHLEDLLCLLRRRWFTRVWVLQEIRVARTAVVICGEMEVDWSAFGSLNLLETFPGFKHKCIPFTPYSLWLTNVPSHMLLYWRPPYAVRLLQLLERTREFDATDARDKLFAILPILQRESQEYLFCSPDAHSSDEDTFDAGQVDYNRSAEEVFTYLSGNLIDAIGLDVLRTVITPTQVPHLPSWATDWTKKDICRYRGPARRREIKGPFESRGDPRDHTSPPTWSFSKYVSSGGLESTELHISGQLVGTILKLGEPCDVYQNNFPLQQWESLCDPIHLEKRVARPEMRDSPRKSWEQPMSPFAEVLSENTRMYEHTEWILTEIQQFMSRKLPSGTAPQAIPPPRAGVVAQNATPHASGIHE